MLHAIPRWCRRGGWLALRRSLAGPYFHFFHADDLNEETPVSQYMIDDEKAPGWHLVFRGHVETKLGHIKPPPVTGGIDWVITIFVLSVMGSVIYSVASAIGYAITLVR